MWYQALKIQPRENGDSAGSNPITRFSLGRKGQVVVAVYVDDLLIAGPDLEAIKKVKEELHRTYEMDDLGENAQRS